MIASVIRYVLVAALLLLLAVLDKPARTLWWDAAFDGGHVPLFAAIALLVRAELASRRPDAVGARTSWGAFAIAGLLGAAVEVVQAFTPHRAPSWVDLARDAAGAGAALLCWHAWAAATSARAASRGRAVALGLAGLTLIGAALADVAAAAVVVYQRARAMPTIVAFDGSRWERRILRLGRTRVTPPGPAPAAGVPAGLARVDLRPGTYPGITIDEPYPDWRGHEALVFTVASDLDAPLALSLRVHDARHDNRYRDRFNTQFTVARGARTIRIPLDRVRRAPDRREMDLSRIRGVVIFASGLPQPTHFFIGPMRLE